MIDGDLGGQSSGSTILSEGKMLLPGPPERVIGKDTYLVAGELRRNIADFDASLARHGVYFEEQGIDYLINNPLFFVQSKTGTRIVQNGSMCFRSVDNGQTYSTDPFGFISGYYAKCLATDDAGTWICLGQKNNTGVQVLKSTDDGVTWTDITNSFPNMSANKINNNYNHEFDSIVYYKHPTDNSKSRWLAVYTSEDGTVDNGGIYWSADGVTWTRLGIGALGMQGAFVMPPQDGSGVWALASTEFHSNAMNGGTVWLSDDDCATWRIVAQDNKNFHNQQGIEGLFFAGGRHFVVVGTNSSGRTRHLIEFNINAQDTTDFVVNERFYDESQYNQFIDTIPKSFSNKVFNSYFEGVTYLGNGFATIDGVSFYRIRNGSENYAVTDIPFVSGGELWSRWANSSTLGKKPHGKSIKVVGSDVGFSQGGLVQYIKVKGQ